jgi:hypothetical protein
MYKIKVEYGTGDSFNSYDEEKILSLFWENIDIAKQNLVRIREHYEWVENDGPQPKWMKNVKGKQYAEDKFNISLLKDNGSEEKVCASWIGYFERLYGASIVSDPEDGWSFKINPFS